MQSQARNIPSIADQPQNISADGATEHLAAWASAAMRACATFWRCVALAHAIDHLNAMTDGQLAECNL